MVEYNVCSCIISDYGPLTRTTDPHVFKQRLNALAAHGGGDAPEMCLSGLQV